MSCNRTICSIWHECDKELGEELKPLCAEENFNSLQQLKAEIEQFKKRALDIYVDGIDNKEAWAIVRDLAQLSAI